MHRLGVALTLLLGLPCLAPAQGFGPIYPEPPTAPGDTLIVFEHLASRDGLEPGELSYRVHRCLPDGRFEPAPAVQLDALYFADDTDSTLLEGFPSQEGPAFIIMHTRDSLEQLHIRRTCLNQAYQRWAYFGSNTSIAAYELRTGAASVRDAPRRVRLLPDDGASPLFCSYSNARRADRLSIRDEPEGTLCLDRYYEPASQFFRPQPQQSPVILIYDYYGSDLDIERDDQGRPLRLLRFDRASESLPAVASLPACRKVLSIAVDAEGGILVSAFYETGPRLARIDTLDGFSVSWTDCLPPPPSRYWGWSLSNVSAGRVPATCGLFTDAQGERCLEAKLLDSRTLAPLWSGRIPGRPGWARLAGDRVLIHRETTRPLDPEISPEVVVDARWDLFTLRAGPDGLELIPDEHPIEFVKSTADPRFPYNERDILAAIAGRGFLCWRGDSLTWLR